MFITENDFVMKSIVVVLTIFISVIGTVFVSIHKKRFKKTDVSREMTGNEEVVSVSLPDQVGKLFSHISSIFSIPELINNARPLGAGSPPNRGVTANILIDDTKPIELILDYGRREFKNDEGNVW